jgi:putative ABC transport system substrate-binding protein
MTISRIFVALLASCTLMYGQIARARESEKVLRIGYLAPRRVVPEEFRTGLRDLGYIEGRNIVIEPRFAEGKFDRFPRFARELVELKVDAIATLSTPAALAVKQATKTIPVVMLTAGDPLARGIVRNLARPGGNVTGLTGSVGPGELTGKRLELLKEIVPELSLVAILWDAGRKDFQSTQERTAHAAGLLGVEIESLEIRSPEDIKSAFHTATGAGAQGLLTFRHAPVLRGRDRIVALANKNRLPAVYADGTFVTSGGLMSYGASWADLYRRQAIYVDKVLKGINPATLPVEQPRKFELFVNLKTAKQVGITIPTSIMYQADKVIR